MRSALLCAYSAERIILNFAFVALCGALQTHFHGRDRNGKRHLQRRFLRKRGAGVSVLALSGANAPALPRGEPLAWRYSFRLKCKVYGLARASPFGRGGTAQAVTERASPFENFPTEKGCPPIGRQPFPEENKENTRPKGQSEYQNMLSSL